MLFNFLFYLLLCVYICLCLIYVGPHVMALKWLSGQILESVLSFDPPFGGLQGPNSAGQACTAVSLLGEPPHQLFGGFLFCCCLFCFVFNESKRYFEKRVCDFL